MMSTAKKVNSMFRAALILSAGMMPLFAQCTVADMKGDFATQPQGHFTVGPVAGPFAATGVIHFDGAGRFTGVATSSFNGGVIYPFDAVGDYTVTPDCQLKVFETTLRITFEGYLANNKNEVVLFQPDPTSVTVNVLRRTNLTQADCTPSKFRDTWAIQASGDNIATGGKFAQNGRFTFDGIGGLTGNTNSSVNGKIVRETIRGTYRVDFECNFAARFFDSKGAETNIFGTLFDSAKQFIFIVSDDGLVITGFGKRP